MCFVCCLYVAQRLPILSGSNQHIHVCADLVSTLLPLLLLAPVLAPPAGNTCRNRPQIYPPTCCATKSS